MIKQIFKLASEVRKSKALDKKMELKRQAIRAKRLALKDKIAEMNSQLRDLEAAEELMIGNVWKQEAATDALITKAREEFASLYPQWDILDSAAKNEAFRECILEA